MARDPRDGSRLLTPDRPLSRRDAAALAARATTTAAPPPRPEHDGTPPRRGRWRVRLAAATAVAAILALAWAGFGSFAARGGTPVPSVRQGAALELPPPRSFPGQDTVRTREGLWLTQYAPDEVLLQRILRYVRQYRPEGAVVLVSDLQTGQVRAVVERDSAGVATVPRLALRGTFPAASLAKIITAAAALEAGVSRPQDNLPLLGGAHTLYRSQLRVPSNGRYHTVTLREAFARSINPSFGLLGLRLGPEPLRDMAERFGFNQPALPPDRDDADHATTALPARLVAPDSGFGLAEVASGFTRATTISPLHALRIARAIGSDGRMKPVRFTRELRSLDDGRVLVLPEGDAAPFASETTRRQLRVLMEATVTSGTARRGFRRNMNERDWAALEMGGKTGSLTGNDPPGRYEWFVGYARRREQPDQGIAVAVMLINRTYMAVHATELAGLVIRDWARYSSPYPGVDGNKGPYLAGR